MQGKLTCRDSIQAQLLHAKLSISYSIYFIVHAYIVSFFHG